MTIGERIDIGVRAASGRRVPVWVPATACALALALAAPAVASEQIGPGGPQSASTEVVLAAREPSYQVLIPAGTRIPFDATSTPLGETGLVPGAHLGSGSRVRISAEPGPLADGPAEIPYVLSAAGAAFSSAEFSAHDAPAELSIEVSREAWDAAPAGSYAGSIAFTVEYMNGGADGGTS